MIAATLCAYCRDQLVYRVPEAVRRIALARNSAHCLICGGQSSERLGPQKFRNAEAASVYASTLMQARLARQETLDQLDERELGGLG
jgi:hypothetical protein